MELVLNVIKRSPNCLVVHMAQIYSFLSGSPRTGCEACEGVAVLHYTEIEPQKCCQFLLMQTYFKLTDLGCLEDTLGQGKLPDGEEMSLERRAGPDWEELGECSSVEL